MHLERIESSWKRKKHEKDKHAAKKENNEEDLEMTTGTAEDEFLDVMGSVRERELLFGPNTLLSTFAPIIVNICSNRQKFSVRIFNLASSFADSIYSFAVQVYVHLFIIL